MLNLSQLLDLLFDDLGNQHCENDDHAYANGYDLAYAQAAPFPFRNHLFLFLCHKFTPIILSVP